MQIMKGYHSINDNLQEMHHKQLKNFCGNASSSQEGIADDKVIERSQFSWNKAYQWALT